MYFETGKDFKRWRENNGYSVAELAEGIGCTRQAIYYLERQPSFVPDLIQRLIDNGYLDVSGDNND